MGTIICLLCLSYQWVPKLGRSVLYDILRIPTTGVYEELAGRRSRPPTGEGLEQDWISQGGNKAHSQIKQHKEEPEKMPECLN